jgi:hypothetical protein
LATELSLKPFMVRSTNSCDVIDHLLPLLQPLPLPLSLFLLPLPTRMMSFRLSQTCKRFAT